MVVTVIFSLQRRFIRTEIGRAGPPASISSGIGISKRGVKDMSYKQFIEQNKGRLLAFYILSRRFNRRFVLETPYPPSELSDIELADLKKSLNGCMPLDSKMVDLWDWDIHFEDALEDDWYFEAVFGEAESAQICAEELAIFFLGKVDEYGIDYNQDAFDSNDFEVFIHDEALKFVTSWRQSVFERYTQPGAPE